MRFPEYSEEKKGCHGVFLRIFLVFSSIMRQLSRKK